MTQASLLIIGSGTSSGVPIPGCDCPVCTSQEPRNVRMRTSAVLRLPSGNQVLIDATTDLRHQALRAGIRRVHAVLFTHAHADHILGIDDLRAYNFLQRTAIPCYGFASTLDSIRRTFWYVFHPDETYQGSSAPRLQFNTLHPYEPLSIEGVPILPLELLHGRTVVAGFRIGDLVYATDCNAIPQRSWEAMRGARTLILDALRYNPHPTHFTIPQAEQLSAELGIPQTYLIHLSHDVDYQTVSKNLRSGVELAYDGLELPIRL